MRRTNQVAALDHVTANPPKYLSNRRLDLCGAVFASELSPLMFVLKLDLELGPELGLELGLELWLELGLESGLELEPESGLDLGLALASETSWEESAIIVFFIKCWKLL